MELFKTTSPIKLPDLSQLEDGIYLLLHTDSKQRKDDTDHLVLLVKFGSDWKTIHFYNSKIELENNNVYNNADDSIWLFDISTCYESDLYPLYFAYLDNIFTNAKENSEKLDTEDIEALENSGKFDIENTEALESNEKLDVAFGYLFLAGYFDLNGNWVAIDFKKPTFTCVGFIASVIFGLLALNKMQDDYMEPTELEQQIVVDIYALSKGYWHTRRITQIENNETMNNINTKFGIIEARLPSDRLLRIRPKEFIFAFSMNLS